MKVPLKVSITILCVSSPGEDYNYTEYIYDGVVTHFESTFGIKIKNLHEAFFGEVVVVFYRRLGSNKTIIGVSKLRLKNFVLAEEVEEFSSKLLPPSFLHRADFYDQEAHSIGEVLGNAKASIGTEELGQGKNHEPPYKKLLNYFMVEEKAKIFKIFIDLFFETQRGTVLCKINWFFGLISAEYYYNRLYNDCDTSHCTSCNNDFCRRDYKEMDLHFINSGIKNLRYAAVSFGNSFVTWSISKIRSLPSIRNKRLRSILERTEINEEDIVIDSTGKEDSLTFTAFYRENRMIVSLKGTTLGFEAVHDLNCDYVHFQDGYAHRGILKLSDHFIQEYWPAIRLHMSQKSIKSILFTGHSLGASASLLIYMRLKEARLDLDISVVGFAPAPVLSYSLAKRDMPDVKMYIYGTDIVSRLNFGSVMDLKYICISISSLYDYFTDKQLVYKKTQAIKAFLKERQLYTKLYHGGILYHIRSFKTEDSVEYRYKEVGLEFFEDLLLIKRSPLDHMLHVLYKAFEMSLKRFT